MLAHLSFKGKALAYIKAQTANKIRDFIRTKESNLRMVRQELHKIQQSIAAAEERYLMQPDLSAVVYKKVMTAMKVEEATLQTKVAELTCSDQVFLDKHDLIMSSIGDVQASFNRFSILQKHRIVRTVQLENFIDVLLF